MGNCLLLRKSGAATGIYGIVRDTSGSSPEYYRTDDSASFTFTPTNGNVVGHSDFDNKSIYRDIKRVTMGTDVMVQIPKFYYQRLRDGNKESIRISASPHRGFNLHPAFDRPGGVKEYIRVGAYKTSGTQAAQKSVTNASPLVNITRGNFRAGAKQKGAGWGIIDYATVNAIQILCLVEIGTNDAQAIIGQGYSNASAALKTGTTDDIVINKYYSGSSNLSSQTVDAVWRGIEGFWGNVWEWTDGLNWNGGKYYISNDPSIYADDTSNGYTELSYTGATNWSQSYIGQVGYDVNNSWCMMPTSAGGGAHTYYTDAIWSSTGWRVFKRGGN